MLQVFFMMSELWEKRWMGKEMFLGNTASFLSVGLMVWELWWHFFFFRKIRAVWCQGNAISRGNSSVVFRLSTVRRVATKLCWGSGECTFPCYFGYPNPGKLGPPEIKLWLHRRDYTEMPKGATIPSLQGQANAMLTRVTVALETWRRLQSREADFWFPKWLAHHTLSILPEQRIKGYKSRLKSQNRTI